MAPAIADMVRLLAPEFRDPLEPAFCAACVCCLRDQLESCSDKENKAMLRQLRGDHHELLTGIMLFLTTERTDDARVTLTVRLRSVMTRCPLGADHSDDTADLVDSGILEVAAIALFDLVHRCFAGATRMARKQSFNRNGLWPASDTDILPLGPAASCPGLLGWFSLLRDCTVFTALAELLLLCPALMTTIVETDSLRHSFLGIIAGHLDLSVAEHAQCPERSDEEDAQAPLSLLRYLAILMEAVTARCGPQGTHSFGRLIAGEEDALLAAIMRASDVVRDAETKQHLYNFALSIHVVRRTDPDNIPRPVAQWLFTWVAQVGGTSEAVYDLLRQVSARRVCAATGCGRPEHALETRLLVCGQCHVLRYCSRACQKAHWKSGKTPHKEACPLIKQLLDTADLNLGRAEFADACRAAKIPHETVARIYESLKGERGHMDNLLHRGGRPA